MKTGSLVLAVSVLMLLTGMMMNADSPLLKRRYREGATLQYRMTASNQDREKVTHYQAEADGVVHLLGSTALPHKTPRFQPSGVFVVDFQWSQLSFDGMAFPLSPESRNFRQELSLEPAFTLSVPNLGKVQPALIGPILDLMTFYADTQLAMRQKRLARTGDHVYVTHGKPNSWADHVRTLVGEDAIDFDITLESVNRADGTATLMVRHVPPHTLKIQVPAGWMQVPVANTPNNWVQVTKQGGKYVASVGQEVFTDRIRLGLADGKILSATMENPVKVLERDCSDVGLQSCGSARRYRISRHVEIRLSGK